MTSLRQRFIEDMQVRNFSPVTQASYAREVSGFARYFNKSPELLGPEQIRAYQVYLTNERKLGVVSISVATSALRFLYRVTLKKNWCMADMIPAPKVPKKLPIILSPEEVVRPIRISSRFGKTPTQTFPSSLQRRQITRN